MSDDLTERLRKHEAGARQQCTCRSDWPNCIRCDLGLAADEIKRLRTALEEYACPGRGACPVPWDERGCSLGEDCGLIAADALAGYDVVTK
jgi:hypothetical protein